MSVPKKSQDQYSNKMYGTAVESAPNTLTFREIATNVSVFDKAAFIIHRLEWYIDAATFNLIVASDDTFRMALTASQNITALGLDNPAVIDLDELQGKVSSAVGFQYRDVPVVRDFSSLPGGGLIVAPRPLFVAVQGVSLAAVGTAKMRAYFTIKTLSADEYLELVDFYRIVGV